MRGLARALTLPEHFTQVRASVVSRVKQNILEASPGNIEHYIEDTISDTI
jgi:hypothetical protein